ncbi:MAG: TetR/AcrR family transcriptional regulator [Deltaproteobacteria bacterium]|nr:TetR/AcrR family transcriptional regulator [Deltaproteobacteria bacterium]
MKKASREPGKDLVYSPAKDADLIDTKHQQIVHAACHLFFKKGYHRTTIREIAIASGMSMGQLYHYISSKDDVLFLTYKQMQMIWYEHLIRSGVEEIQDRLERLTKAVRLTLEFSLKYRKLFFFVYTETQYLEKRHLRVVLEMDDKNVVGFWRRLLRDVARSAKIKDDVDFLANLVSYLMVFLPLRGWNLKGKTNDRHLDSMTAFILRGLGLQDGTR